MGMDLLGRVAFYVGLVISVIAGWVEVQAWWLAVLGIIVGLLNVTAKENSRFLLATLVLVTAGIALGTVFGAVVERILVAYIAFTAAAAFIVALKEVYSIQKGK
ncbi:MAG: hypothetical protein QW165_05010 [Candidatus Woesearchaeota archaeon]